MIYTTLHALRNLINESV